ncbi:S41 family peptidase [Pedobacter cryoconitis]|uniref:S41 family peptidase n=1 Tax=Pedobacter cryoconitis TaxID=188932 RepID=UPI001616CD13|nr:S41 family peptidase [Pedobacter cryoconitis]MBB5644923.1 hypothetical protein [Pedobacter cryoconitis]
MKLSIIIALILLPFFSDAQSCNCSENFKFLVGKIKNNYVGYKDKIKPSNQERFNVFTDSLQKVADSSNINECKDVYLKWLSFFKDRHLGISSFKAVNASNDYIRTYFSKGEVVSWNELSFDKYLQDNKGKLDKIEGYWSNFPTYQIGIVKDSIKNNEFVGFILKADSIYWMPKQVKFRIKKVNGNYQVIYYKPLDHSKNSSSIRVKDSILDFDGFGKYYKGKGFKDNPEATAENQDLSPSFKVLDKETNLLVIPYAIIKYKKSVDSILVSNKKLLEKTEHLIIDLRNNSGGQNGTFENILPYLYTNPIYTEGDAVLATADNIRDGYDVDMTGYPEKTKKLMTEEVKKFKAHVGELYSYPADTLKFDHILKNPQRISILIDKSSASATEIFLLKAEQSKKVVLFGENSAGAIDYLDVIIGKMPCENYSVRYPAVRSNRVNTRPLDNVGIPPNVFIPDSVTDWVKFVRNYKRVH